STMNCWPGAASSPVPATPSGPRVISGSSGCSGMKMVSLRPFSTRSRPWSKNWPKNTNHRLKGADRPSSGATLSNENWAMSSSVPLAAAGAAGPRDSGGAWVSNSAFGAQGAGAAGGAGNRHGRWVVAGLVDDQVGDDARVGVDHAAGGAVVGVGDHRRRG